ncbi:collagen alpha-2(I) chain-like [Dasypus novemcinctus]|uniref:collagen alpha-2(I) chain-like n=1 Tax=Dasypus novemcinctus TaxID=9361 RepID=UPI0039C8D2CC
MGVPGHKCTTRARATAKRIPDNFPSRLLALSCRPAPWGAQSDPSGSARGPAASPLPHSSARRLRTRSRGALAPAPGSEPGRDLPGAAGPLHAARDGAAGDPRSLGYTRAPTCPGQQAAGEVNPEASERGVPRSAAARAPALPVARNLSQLKSKEKVSSVTFPGTFGSSEKRPWLGEVPPASSQAELGRGAGVGDEVGTGSRGARRQGRAALSALAAGAHLLPPLGARAPREGGRLSVPPATAEEVRPFAARPLRSSGGAGRAGAALASLRAAVARSALHHPFYSRFLAARPFTPGYQAPGASVPGAAREGTRPEALAAVTAARGIPAGSRAEASELGLNLEPVSRLRFPSPAFSGPSAEGPGTFSTLTDHQLWTRAGPGLPNSPVPQSFLGPETTRRVAVGDSRAPPPAGPAALGFHAATAEILSWS